MNKKNFIYSAIVGIFALNITACGNSPTYIQAPPPAYYYENTAYTMSTPNYAAYPNYAPQTLYSTNNQCCCQTETSTNTSTIETKSTPKSNTTKTTTSTKSTTKSGTTVNSGSNSTSAPKTETKTETKPTTTTTLDARTIVVKTLDKIKQANAFVTEIEKYERGISDPSKSITQTLKISGRKPGSVKIEVLAHTKSSSVGAKVSYVRGTGKATVRPGGALSFVTKELDQTDENIISANNYTPEQADFFSMSQRLSDSSYKAELQGKTTISGIEVFLVKLTKTGSANELDSRIKHEIFGVDPKTMEVKLWEAYDTSSTDPYLKVTIKYFNIMSDLPDSTFKV